MTSSRKKEKRLLKQNRLQKKWSLILQKLTDCKKIKSIIHGQLLTNIINKMKTRLIPEAAEEVEEMQQLFKQLCQKFVCWIQVNGLKKYL